MSTDNSGVPDPDEIRTIRKEYAVGTRIFSAQQVRSLILALDAAEARVKVLEAGIQPFAAWGEANEGEPDWLAISSHIRPEGSRIPTMGDCHKAFAAMGKGSGNG